MAMGASRDLEDVRPGNAPPLQQPAVRRAEVEKEFRAGAVL